jgi:hypothetical protein
MLAYLGSVLLAPSLSLLALASLASLVPCTSPKPAALTLGCLRLLAYVGSVLLAPSPSLLALASLASLLYCTSPNTTALTLRY